MSRMPRTGESTESLRKAAVVGSPVAHSLSPVLHEAAYQELGLTGWTYERIDVNDDGLPAFVSGLGREWTGLSVTMPGKRVALELADRVTDRARAVGAANTLVRTSEGWRADCTDGDGVVGALRVAGGTLSGARRAVVLGAGGTAAAAIYACAQLGLPRGELVVRDPLRAGEAVAAARRVGLDMEVHRWSETDFRRLVGEDTVLINTVPPQASQDHLGDLARASWVLDAIYDPWPTPLVEAAWERGGHSATGLDMLLHQAFGQVELFTGHSAPRKAMQDALNATVGKNATLPL